MTFRLGLTGSIGMGKSTTSAMFKAAGVPVWEADAAVHALYAKGGAAVGPLSAAFPEAINDGAVDRTALKALLRGPEDFARLEAVVHPLTAAHRQGFMTAVEGAALVVFDIPLLYEIKAETWLNAVLVVTAPPEVQRARVMQRPDMTEALFASILARQIPDAQKRARADYVIETTGLDAVEAQVRALISALTARSA